MKKGSKQPPTFKKPLPPPAPPTPSVQRGLPGYAILSMLMTQSGKKLTIIIN